MKLPYTLILKILEETKFSPKRNFIMRPETREELEDFGLDPDDVFNCISPRISFRKIGYESRYSAVEVSLRDYSHGTPACEHEMINLRWEEGGGGLDSGTPYSYLMCRKCAFHKDSILEVIKKFFQKLRRGEWE